MFGLLVFIAGLCIVAALRPDFFTWLGYKWRYWRNRFNRDVLNRCPHCKETLSRTGEGRGVCTNDDCGKR